MEYRTYLEIKTKIEEDLDIEDEVFIQSTELLGYVNAGIDDAEAEIHTIYEDYFLSRATISLVSGTDLYTLPSDLYANKIRSILYKNGTTIYEVKRMRGKKAFISRENSNAFLSTDYYTYFVLNTSGLVDPQMCLCPASREDLSNGLIVYYLRNANTMVDDTSVCDIPEFVEYVIQYAKVRVMAKEGNPGLPDAVAEQERLRRQMVVTLSGMVPDEETEIEPDMTFYEEMN